MRRSTLALSLAVVVSGLLFTSSAGSSDAKEPKRVGPVVTIFAGPGWKLAAWQSDHGLCIAFGAAVSPAPCCSHDTHKTVEQVRAWRDGTTTRIVGAVSSKVARVELKLHAGRGVYARLSRAFPELRTNCRFFFAHFRPSTARASLDWTLLAYGAHGNCFSACRSLRSGC